MPTLAQRSSFLRPRMLQFAATSALAAGLLAGCAGSSGPPPARAAANAEVALAKGNTDRAVTLAEQAVLAEPHNPQYRSLLGNAYLAAGRFESAAQAFDDALALGDQAPRTALGLALAEIAAGRGGDAIALLDEWRDFIPAGDLGLALALAGDTARGVAVLTDALRSGEDTPKLRQNLAFAYALDGRWKESYLMAAQDVPADQVPARISGWAAMAKPEDATRRVASLLGSPIAVDPGQPTALALSNTPDVDALGAEALAAAEQPAPVAVELAYAATPAAELPPLEAPVVAGPAVPFAAAAPLAAAPVPASVVAPAAAPAADPAPASAPAERRSAAYRVVGDYVPDTRRSDPQERTASQAAPAAQPSVSTRSPRAAAPDARDAGSHVVQLGAFSSEEGARRAAKVFAARYPGLAGYRSVTTTATVNGKRFWRVSATGLEGAAAAQSLCRQVRGRGGACLVMRAPSENTLPGAAPTRMARRR